MDLFSTALVTMVHVHVQRRGNPGITPRTVLFLMPDLAVSRAAAHMLSGAASASRQTSGRSYPSQSTFRELFFRLTSLQIRDDAGKDSDGNGRRAADATSKLSK